MSRFLSDRYGGIVPYTPGEQPQNLKLIKLNTNESPFPPSPRVLEAVLGEAASLNLYSDPESELLTKAIAENIGLKPSEVLACNGSDEVLAFAFQAFCDKVRQPSFADITYGFYPVFCRLFSLTPKIIPLDGELRINPTDYYGAKGPIFIANPNAPTGLALTLDEIEEILKHNRDNIVLIDEAYVDFGGETALPLLKSYDNLIICRTFSKSRNLAGARLGFAAASEEIITDLKKIKYSFNPYNVNSMSAAAGREAMLDTAYFETCVAKIIEARDYTTGELRSRGFSVPESKANFIFPCHSRIGGEEYYRELRARNILVRYFGTDRIKNHVRITIGSMEQMEALIKATDNILNNI